MVLGTVNTSEGKCENKLLITVIVAKFCQLLGTSASFERALPTQFSALHMDVVRPLLESRVSPSFSDLALRRRKEKRRDE